MKDEMSNVISFFKEFLLDIEFMNVGNKYSILYSIKNSNGKILYYEGGNPKHNLKNEHLKKIGIKSLKNLGLFMKMSMMVFIIILAEVWGLVLLKM
ncbi:hypothetical protein [Clostridium sp. ZBS13]|uniref:hypothetical protein n=1 Tax=Clostridium sp. ZBS13 TaxID=2949971 RepID=UPI00207AA3AF|nr:hypothetical protein [Clostridium sp. ZBS13]